jgi:hypothetical protein
MAMAKAKSTALSVAEKCRVPLATTFSARYSLTLALTLILALPSAEHLGSQLGGAPQHHQSRRQGKVRAPLPTRPPLDP